MLRGIKNASSNWIGKSILMVVITFLVISFAVWGIGDIFRGFGQNSVAKIGNTEISIEQFRQFYTDRLQQISRQVGRPITPDQARALGFDRQVLGQMVAETTLDEQAGKLRLGIADAEIARRITADPNFQGVNGQFDHARFEYVIRQAGYTEPRFIAEQRRVTLRRQIAQSVSGELKVPQAMLETINQFQNERRNIQYVTLNAAQAGDIPAPTPEALAAYFEERKILFRAPEYRKVTMLSLSPSEIAKPDTVSDAEAKTFYDQNTGNFGSAERREVRQIVFPTPEEATAAHERIKQGLSFADLAKERGLSDADTIVGLVTKPEIIDAAVADAAFSTKTGETSAPVKGTFGTVLVQVGKIEAGAQKPFAEVAPEIKRNLAEVRARSEIGGLRDKIDDERAAGSTLAETATKLGLKARTIEAVDRSGRAPDGTPVADLPKQPDVITPIFASDIGADTEPQQLPGGGYIWHDVTAITQARERPLDEVKDQVAARWRDDEIGKVLQAKADEMLAKLKAGTTLAQAAEAANLQVQTGADLQRRRASGFVPAKLIEAAFTVPNGGFGIAAGDQQTERYVFTVTEVTDPKLDPAVAEVQQLTSTLQNAYADDIVSQYIAKLEADYGVRINQQALNQVIGGGAGQ